MPISRVFNATEDAMAAAAELKRATHGGVGIYVADQTDEALSADSIAARGVSKADAHHLAERVKAGGTLMIADTAFGFAGVATEILRRPRPGDTSAPEVVTSIVPEPTPERLRHEAATPLSSAFGWPVLASEPAPLSRSLKLPTLLRGPTPQRAASPVARKASPLSSLLGLPVLSGNPAPFSRMIGQPPLSPNATPLSSRLGVKVLSEEAAPLSSRLRMRQLARDPAPLSSLLRLPVLLKSRSRRP